MKDSPIITVLMPVYNAGKFLREAIESVLNQTFQNFEFLIIDDGSVDNSVAIIKSYTDPRIQFYQNERNLGVTATLNKGIELAKSALIARMDADDICYPNRLERQYDFILSHPDGALYACWAEEVTADLQPIRTERFAPGDYFYNLTFSCWTYHPTLIYRRDEVKSIGMYTASYAEDYELVWQLSRRYKMYTQPEVLLRYRVSNQSVWQVTKRKENINALLGQMERNIRFYFDDPDQKITVTQIEQLGMDEPAHGLNVQEALSCIRLLDSVTANMLRRENVNLKPEELKSAARRKRDYMLSKFFVSLGLAKGTQLLIKAQAYHILWNMALRKVKRK